MSKVWPSSNKVRPSSSSDDHVLVKKQGVIASLLARCCGCVARGVDAALSDEELVLLIMKALVKSVKESAAALRAPPPKPAPGMVGVAILNSTAASLTGVRSGAFAPVHLRGEAAQSVLSVSEVLKLQGLRALVRRMPEELEDMDGPQWVGEVLSWDVLAEAPPVPKPPFPPASAAWLTYLFANSIGHVLLRRDTEREPALWLVADNAMADGLEREPTSASTSFVVRFEVVSSDDDSLPPGPRGVASSLVLRSVLFAGEDVAVDDDDPAFVLAARGIASGLFGLTQSVYHAWFTHGAVSNNFVYASSSSLPAEHALRRLLAMTETGAFKINELGEETLFASSHNTFSAFLGLTDEGTETLARRAADAFDLRLFFELPYSLSEHYRLAGVDDLSFCPPLEDALAWWQAMETHVRAYTSLYYPTPGAAAADAAVCEWYRLLGTLVAGATRFDSLQHAADAAADVDEVVRLATTVIWAVSIYHELMGKANWSYLDPYEGISAKWRTPRRGAGGRGDDEVMLEERLTDRWSWFRQLNVAYTTTARSTPLSTDFSYMAKDAEAEKVMKKFHVGADDDADGGTMAAVGKAIRLRNAKRSPPFGILMPDELECSVAV